MIEGIKQHSCGMHALVCWMHLSEVALLQAENALQADSAGGREAVFGGEPHGGVLAAGHRLPSADPWAERLGMRAPLCRHWRLPAGAG